MKPQEWSDFSNESLRALRLAVETHALVSHLDIEGRITYINPQFEKTSGYSKSELLGKDLRVLDSGFHPGDFYEKMWSTLQAGKIWAGRVCNRAKTGRFFWENRILTPAMDPSGRILEFLSIGHDITAENEQRQVIDRLIRNAPGMIYQFHLRPDGFMYLPFVSHQAFDIYEVTPEDFKSDPSIMVKMVHPDDQAELNEAILLSAQQLSQFDWTGRLISKTGKLRWIRARSIPERLPDGGTLWDGIVIDITEDRKVLEDLQIERSKSIHSSKLATIGEMAAGVAHEINNPLAIIQGSADLLKKENSLSGTLTHRLLSIQRSVDRISKIVTGLRRFSRVSDSAAWRPTGVSEIANESAVLCHARALRNNVELRCEIETNAPCNCNGVEIEQILVNLINNGIDAAKLTDERWVRLRVFEDRDQVVFRVTDSGNGIPESIRRKLFQPFFTTKDIGEGTGLGLGIAKSIARAHGGTLEYIPDQAHTTFELRLLAHREKGEVTNGT